MKLITALFLALTVSAIGAQTSTRVPVVPNADHPTFPWVELRSSSDGKVHLPFDAEVVESSSEPEVSEVFPHALHLRIHVAYQLSGLDRTSDFGLVFSGFDPDESVLGTHKSGDIVGKSSDKAPRLVAWSLSLDPYLVLSSPKKPVSLANRFWFAPEFLFSNGGTAYFSFDPIPSLGQTLGKMAAEAEESPGFVLYPHFKVRFSLSLPAAPRALTDDEKADLVAFERPLYGRTGLFTHANELVYEGRTYLLCWQSGFDQYLQKETQPGQPLWIYAGIVSYDAFKKIGYVFVRDFSLHSVEEMVKSRLDLFQ